MLSFSYYNGVDLVRFPRKIPEGVDSADSDSYGVVDEVFIGVMYIISTFIRIRISRSCG